MKLTRRHSADIVAVATTAGLIMALASTASAQHEVDIEVPVLIMEEGGDYAAEDHSLDLSNMVMSASKGVTTVQEAPAIVTVITSDEIEERGYPNIEAAIDGVPGYLKNGGMHNQFAFPLTRGLIQAELFLKDGVSMFDPVANVASIWRVLPMETIKRIEMISGPGGVLWGANSFLGIVNVITKDAEDVDGVEGRVTAGDGNGDRQTLRGYVMAGIPELFSDKAKLFIHGSFETYQDSGYEMPGHYFSQPTPNPNSLILYGALKRANPPRSMIFNFDGKLTVGKVNFYWSAPMVQRETSLGWPGYVADQDRVEDILVWCSDGSYALPGQCPTGTTEEGLRCPRPEPGEPLFDEVCLDPDRRSRTNRVDWFDRYAIAEYQTRLAGGKAGITVKAFFTQFVREYGALGVLAPIAGLLEGGLTMSFDMTNYRAGGLVDGDIELPSNLRLLYGVEAFHEWLPDNTSRSRQEPGVETQFAGPYQEGRLPIGCPIGRAFDEDGNPTGTSEFLEGCPTTFLFEASRTILSAYLSPQWKPSKKLTIDGGARLQIAPESLGITGYPLEAVFSSALVYGFAKNWYLKLNYAEGFRPPVFNNTHSNGDSVNVGGTYDLTTETSEAIQGEVNARIFKGERAIRELSFRADYSYTMVHNVILPLGAVYVNAEDRAMHSTELFARLYLKGGHRVELGYTWLKMNLADRGEHKGIPEHWFNLTGFFKLSDKLAGVTTLRVVGAMEDPNRMVEYRGHAFDEFGRVINVSTGARELITVEPHEISLDRIPPSANLMLGLSYQATDKLALSAYSYNSLNSRYFQPDAFLEYEPRYEFTPNPAQDFYFRLNATYTY